MDGHEANRRIAFDNIVRALDFDKLLPERVFVGTWSHFLFFQSDRMFAPEFPKVVSELMRLENSKVSCLLNLDKTEALEFGQIAAVFLNRALRGAEYSEKLRGGGPADGWLYRVDRYACASDVGEWCIYCEKSNDVALIGLRDVKGVEKFEKALAQLWAKPIEELIYVDQSPVFPFGNLTPAWRHGLLRYYGRSKT